MVACPVTSIHASIGSLCVNSFGHLWVFYMRWQLKQIKCRDFFPLLGALSLLWSVFPSEVDIFIFIPSPSFQVSAIALQEFDSFESLFWCYNCYSICWRMIDPLTDQFKNCSKKKRKGNAKKTDGTEQVYSYIFRKVHIRLYHEVSEGFPVMTSLQCTFPAEA